MQCPSCQHVIDPEVDGDSPVNCPACGAPLDADSPVFESAPVAVATAPVATAEVKAVKAPKKAAGGARALVNRMLAVFIFVGAITIAVGSTLVAMRTIKERDQLRSDYSTAIETLDKTVVAAGKSPRLSNAEARQDVLGPALAGYQTLVQSSNQDPERLDQALRNTYVLAALQAKLGTSACTGSLQAAEDILRRMDEGNYAADRYASLNDTALQATAPMDWAMMKDADIKMHATAMLFSFQGLTDSFRRLSMKHPEATVFRNDLAGMQRISGTLQAAFPGRSEFALVAWTDARDVLETLVRDEPANLDFKKRLVEALAGAASLQQKKGENAEAIANYKRAVEVQQQLVDGSPEDKSATDLLAKYKTSLEKLEASDTSNVSAAAQ